MAENVMKVLALSGSLRKESFNTRLLHALAGASPAGMRVYLDDGLRSLPLFDEDLEGSPPASVLAMRDAVARADALVIATPEYLHSIPGGLKNALDWLSRGDRPPLGGKPVAIIGATTGGGGTRLAQAALRQALFSAEALVMPSPVSFLNHAAGLFAPDGSLANPRVRQALGETLLALHEWSALVGKRP